MDYLSRLNLTNLKLKLALYKQKVMLGLAGMVIFLVGYGTAKMEQRPAVQHGAKPGLTQRNYTTTEPAPTNSRTQAPAAKSAANAANAKSCIVKGNISGANKIYHVKGGSFYDRVTPEQCFATEAEAVAAGFRKSSR